MRRLTHKTCLRGTHRQGGATLIELVIVLVVIMVLVLIGTQVYTDQSTRAQREGALTSANAMVKALEMYKAEWGNYPVVTSVTPLYPYANITELQRMFAAVSISKPGSAVCIAGDVKDIAPVYSVVLCAKADPGQVQTDPALLPTCQWAGKHSFRGCQEGL